MTTYICYSKIGPKRLGGRRRGKSNMENVKLNVMHCVMITKIEV